jgi:hypothetical protein
MHDDRDSLSWNGPDRSLTAHRQPLGTRSDCACFSRGREDAEDTMYSHEMCGHKCMCWTGPSPTRGGQETIADTQYMQMDRTKRRPDERLIVFSIQIRLSHVTGAWEGPRRRGVSNPRGPFLCRACPETRGNTRPPECGLGILSQALWMVCALSAWSNKLYAL